MALTTYARVYRLRLCPLPFHIRPRLSLSGPNHLRGPRSFVCRPGGISCLGPRTLRLVDSNFVSVWSIVNIGVRYFLIYFFPSD